jgi:hypothetical protein
MAFVFGDIYDGQTQTSVTSKKLATFSLLDKPLQAMGQKAVLSINSAVFEDNYPILLPRAVAFSAGLINHFFTGRVDLIHNPPVGGDSVHQMNSTWSIINKSNEVMNGVFALYYEDGSGNRQLVANASWTGSLNSGQATPALPEPPSTVKKLIAVFKGTIGQETSLQRVAAKTINFSEIACAIPHKTIMGNNAKTLTFELGSVGGVVLNRFRSIGRIHVAISSGSTQTVLSSFDTYSLQCLGSVAFGVTQNCSGLDTGSNGGFLFDPTEYGYPGNSGATRLNIAVSPIDPGVTWALSMGCPGDNAPPADSSFPKVSVEFDIGSTLFGAVGWCKADLYIDNKLVSTPTIAPAGGVKQYFVLEAGGLPHFVQFKNKQCSSDNRNILTGMSYIDSKGSHYIGDMTDSSVHAIQVY